MKDGSWWISQGPDRRQWSRASAVVVRRVVGSGLEDAVVAISERALIVALEDAKRELLAGRGGIGSRVAQALERVEGLGNGLVALYSELGGESSS